ncbi:MAG: protein translocase subunit SecF [Bacillota bacterium]|nr:protein translocase subunit SecF [Bacillota bacterium]
MSLKNKTFNIIGKRKIWYALSCLIILAGIVSFCVQGLNLGIDFKGGNYMQLTFEEAVDVTELRSLVGEYVEQTPLVQEENSDETYIIRTEVMAEEDVNSMMTDIEEQFGSYTVDRNEAVGPTIGKELTQSAILALVIACALMLVYITVRFKFLFGVSSIITLVHDAAILLAFCSIFQLEISSSFIAAILTVIGYSINATIVIFDRVRENQPNYKVDNLDALVNDSVNQTLARSFNTVITTLLTLLALFFFGGETTRVFVLCLIIGITAGGYSSICLSGSVYRDLTSRFGKDRKKK